MARLGRVFTGTYPFSQYSVVVHLVKTRLYSTPDYCDCCSIKLYVSNPQLSSIQSLLLVNTLLSQPCCQEVFKHVWGHCIIYVLSSGDSARGNVCWILTQLCFFLLFQLNLVSFPRISSSAIVCCFSKELQVNYPCSPDLITADSASIVCEIRAEMFSHKWCSLCWNVNIYAVRQILLIFQLRTYFCPYTVKLHYLAGLNLLENQSCQLCFQRLEYNVLFTLS